MAVTAHGESQRASSNGAAPPELAVLQPRDRRAGRRGADHHARPGAGGRGRRRRRAALLGAALARGPGALPAPRGAGAARPRPTRSPSCSRASRASRGSSPTRWSCCRRSTRCTGAPTTGPRILADEPIRYPQLMLKQKKSNVRLRADRRRGRDRALELPVVDPVRRGRDRADGRQRRRAEAGVADAADRPADPGGLRARRASRGTGANGPRRRRGRPGAGRVERRQDLLHRVRRGRPPGRRGMRAADEGLGARAGRQGPADRLRGREPAERHLRRRLGRLRQRRADLLGHRARPTWCARSPTASSTASCGRPVGADGRRPDSSGTPRSGRWSPRSSTTSSCELVDDAIASGAKRLCGGPGRGARLQRPLHRPDRADRRDARHADHARGDLRPGAADHDRRQRAGGDRPRERLASSGSAPRCGRSTATRASGSRARSSRAWSGSTTTPTRTARASAPGAA